MKIERVVVGSLKENCYLIDIDNEVLVIDPGAEYDKINKVIGKRKVLGILITHNHYDHIGALPFFNNIKIYNYNNLEEKSYNINKFKFDVIYTKGHTSDSISFYFKDNKILFSGDFIFKDSIGRWDMETGSIDDMKKSLYKMKKLDSNTIIYPGHGEITTLDYELKNNYYIQKIIGDKINN